MKTREEWIELNKELKKQVEWLDETIHNLRQEGLPLDCFSDFGFYVKHLETARHYLSKLNDRVLRKLA